MRALLRGRRWWSVALVVLLALPLAAAADPRGETSHRRAVIQTSQGSFTVELFDDRAPRAVENFVGLAEAGRYDRTLIHRAVEGLLVHGGDPTGRGYGGRSLWGEPFANEIDPTLRFDRAGRLALANLGRPETNGSQFFVTVAPASWLDGDYTIFGQVVEGQDVVDRISRVEVRGGSHRPVEDVLVLGVEISPAERSSQP